MSSDTSKNKVAEALEEYKNKCKNQAEKLVTVTFPEKCLALNQLLESKQFEIENLSTIEADLNIPVPKGYNSETNAENSEPFLKKRKLDENHIEGTNVYSLPKGVAPSNPSINEIIDLVKPYIIELIGFANKIRMWITYLIPRIEDGNNFGVSIQEETMAEARNMESEAATYLDQISRYYLTRGQIVAKVAKYPHVEDYRRSVKELDEKEFVSMKCVVCELRNQYASIHDIIVKNMEKIKKPRSSNSDNMY